MFKSVTKKDQVYVWSYLHIKINNKQELKAKQDTDYTRRCVFLTDGREGKQLPKDIPIKFERRKGQKYERRKWILKEGVKSKSYVMKSLLVSKELQKETYRIQAFIKRNLMVKWGSSKAS